MHLRRKAKGLSPTSLTLGRAFSWELVAVRRFAWKVALTTLKRPILFFCLKTFLASLLQGKTEDWANTVGILEKTWLKSVAMLMWFPEHRTSPQYVGPFVSVSFKQVTLSQNQNTGLPGGQNNFLINKVNSRPSTTLKKSHICTQETNYLKAISYKIPKSPKSYLLSFDHREW